MKRYLLYLFVLMSVCGCSNAQQGSDRLQLSVFEQYVKSILEDSSKTFQEYPKPPALTKDVIIGLQEELKDDSAKYYFDQLSVKKFKWAKDYEDALSYYKEKRLTYCILSLTAHWNPDARVSALISLNWLRKLRPLICTTKKWYDKMEREDTVCLAFLIYLLESNPLFISGSENATIHGFYISNILWNLDLFTREKIVSEKLFSDWYKNDLQFETALLQWKSHLTKKQ